MYSLIKPISPRFPTLRWDSLAIVLAILVMTGVAWSAMYSRYQDMGSMSITSVDPLFMTSMDSLDTGDMGDGGPMPMPGNERDFWRGASLFLPMWAVMMSAMMLPAMLPMALTFSTIYRNRRAKGQVYVPIWVFLLGYMIIWGLSGVPGYLAKVGLESLVGKFPTFESAAAVVGGLVLIGAGLYQMSTLKDKCLSHCRTPMSFIVHDWREGYGGALLMGVHHGLYCVGCCWALMVVMFPVGVMNLVWMGGLAVLIFLEKIVPGGQWVSRSSGLVLIIAGASLSAGLL